MAALHLSHVGAEPARAQAVTLVLHGILGSGSNLRAVAQRLAERDRGRAFVLVDLRMHGRSQGFGPPHDIAACAQDLRGLEVAFSAPVSLYVTVAVSAPESWDFPWSLIA